MIDLSGLSTAELTSLKTELLAAYSRALRAQSYQLPGPVSKTNPNVADLLDQIAAVSAALSAAGDPTGGVGVVQIGDPHP